MNRRKRNCSEKLVAYINKDLNSPENCHDPIAFTFLKLLLEQCRASSCGSDWHYNSCWVEHLSSQEIFSEKMKLSVFPTSNHKKTSLIPGNCWRTCNLNYSTQILLGVDVHIARMQELKKKYSEIHNYVAHFKISSFPE